MTTAQEKKERQVKAKVNDLAAKAYGQGQADFRWAMLRSIDQILAEHPQLTGKEIRDIIKQVPVG